MRREGQIADFVFALLVCAAAPAIAQTAANPATSPAANPAVATETIAAGEKLLRDPAKGNCTACHRIGAEPASRAATIGPPLADIKNKFPDHKALVALIGDADQQRTDTIMPPYRRNRILSESEIELVAQYLETL